MYDFQIFISNLDLSVELHVSRSKYLIWIYNKNLKTNTSKAEFFIFPWKPVPHGIFHSCTWNYYQLLKLKIQMSSSFCLSSFITITQLISNFYWLYLQNVTLTHPLFSLFTTTTFPNFYLKHKSNNVIALFSHYRELKNNNNNSPPSPISCYIIYLDQLSRG